ncbi:MAG: hypothetical protein GY841_18075, partial [FCB group bacterium]|nr:hypothetical protein [FCB group bacterium]
DGDTDCADSDCIVDADSDGHNALPCGDDCNDGNPDVSPSDPEVCDNSIDDDCDGDTDCADSDCIVDADSDGHNALPCGDDCNDGNPDVSPSDPEVCDNSIDDDCDGDIDLADSDCPSGVQMTVQVTLGDLGSRPVPAGWTVQALVAVFDTTATSAEVLDPTTNALWEYSGVFTYNATGPYAEFVIDIPVAGTYDITVDSYHTLMNWKQDVDCNNPAIVNIGTLTEGDIDDDGNIGVPDIQAFSSS